MRSAVGIALLAAASAVPQIEYFHLERPVANLPAQGGQACAQLDPDLFAHTAAGLADLRLYRGSDETPYVIHEVSPPQGAEKTVPPLNLGRRGGQTVFDAAMPEGSYSDVEIAVSAQNFIATVTVNGSQAQAGAETKIGSYTIFDLTKQKLGRSTVLHLPASDFRYLHFGITGPIQPDSISHLSIGRMPSGEPKFVTVAQSASITQKGRESVVEFTVPSRVPVDRIVFTPGAEPVNFSRDVSVTTQPVVEHPAADSETPAPVFAASGNLLRVHSVQEGHRIEEERLSIETSRALDDAATKWTITIDNGDDRPIDLKSVRLEMIERNLCFDAAPGAAYTLYFGDPALNAPRYDYARFFAMQAGAAKATLGPEQPNPAYHSRPDQRPFTERYPFLLWAALIAVIALLGWIALRSLKRAPHAS